MFTQAKVKELISRAVSLTPFDEAKAEIKRAGLSAAAESTALAGLGDGQNLQRIDQVLRTVRKIVQRRQSQPSVAPIAISAR